MCERHEFRVAFERERRVSPDVFLAEPHGDVRVDAVGCAGSRTRMARRRKENFSRCIYCGLCEEACPTLAIQLSPDFEMAEYVRKNMVYEKEDLLIAGGGKHQAYNFYRVSGLSIKGKDKGQGYEECPPIDVHALD